MARYAGTTTQRGLGWDHVSDKKRLLALHRNGDLCWRCGQPMYKWQQLDRDHVTARALGGAQGPAVLAHASCNRSAGARLGNRLKPRVIMAAGPGRDTTCGTCGKRYWYAARMCGVCGNPHYHPNRRDQRTCSRACGMRYRQRKYGPSASRHAAKPKPPCENCGKPCSRAGRFCSRACMAMAKAAVREARLAQQPGPATPIAYYTCRYCGKPGAAHGTGQRRREVCPARECQLARIQANNLRIRNGLTREQADAVTRQAVRPAADAPWWTTVQPHRAHGARRG